MVSLEKTFCMGQHGWDQEDLEKTAQFARMPTGQLKKHFKSLFSAANVHHRIEPAATDSVKSNTPAFVASEMAAPLFVGTKTLCTGCHGMKADKEFVNTLTDKIRKHGTMTKLISDRA